MGERERGRKREREREKKISRESTPLQIFFHFSRLATNSNEVESTDDFFAAKQNLEQPIKNKRGMIGRLDGREKKTTLDDIIRPWQPFWCLH